MIWIKLVLSALFTWPILLVFKGILWVAGWIVVGGLLIADKWKIIRPTTGFRPKWIEELMPIRKRGDWVDYWPVKWAALWGNWEDGISGPYEPGGNDEENDWYLDTLNWPYWKQILVWSCLRNPVGNLRWSKLGTVLDRSKQEWVGNSKNPWEDHKNGNEFFRKGLYQTLMDSKNGEEAISFTRLFLKTKRGDTFWCWARQGLLSGLWIVKSDGMVYRIGTKIFPGYDREIDRYVGLITLQRGRREA